MGTFMNFTAIQILREIKVGSFRGSKTVILAIFEALEFDFGENSIFVSVRFRKYLKPKLLKGSKW